MSLCQYLAHKKLLIQSVKYRRIGWITKIWVYFASTTHNKSYTPKEYEFKSICT